MEIGKKTIVIMGLAFVLVAIVPVSAYMYFWQSEPQQIPTGIVLQTPSVEMGLGIYWDIGGGNPVTTIDFGRIWHPNTMTTFSTGHIHIINEGNVSHTIYWNSTLSSVTSEITEDWFSNGTVLPSPGDKCSAQYRIHVPAYATVGTYNWTLTVWAEYTY